MMNKKFASLMMASALITAMGTTSAFAATPTTPYCTVNSCNLTGDHQHNGTTYAAHTNGDGHTYHNGNHESGRHKSGRHHG